MIAALIVCGGVGLGLGALLGAPLAGAIAGLGVGFPAGALLVRKQFGDS